MVPRMFTEPGTAERSLWLETLEVTGGNPRRGIAPPPHRCFFCYMQILHLWVHTTHPRTEKYGG